MDVAAVLLRPVRPGSALEATLARLTAAVRLGVFAEGTRLPPERELAARLAVSRMTLREALRALQATGEVEARLAARRPSRARGPHRLVPRLGR